MTYEINRFNGDVMTGSTNKNPWTSVPVSGAYGFYSGQLMGLGITNPHQLRRMVCVILKDEHNLSTPQVAANVPADSTGLKCITPQSLSCLWVRIKKTSGGVDMESVCEGITVVELLETVKD